ncbi:uncharacterized mitochondrial protein AtMg00810-like [Vigna angularis]|uniref:uncharacterized mitochondrial protein AtMg00810-like n=1 Tax=Phaseolus angularis TaxID=3914 RepID=UPI000809C1D6|nr:uncharacterized mitochondrial protein AtMg00810-like [Vigna angularis]
MTDLGILSYFLGLEFIYSEKGVIMHQRKYISDVLERFNMLGCKSAETPAEMNLKLATSEGEAPTNETLFRQIVGSLRFICQSRPEITYSVALVSRIIRSPKQIHMLAAKRILRYLKGTVKYGILFSNIKEGNVETRLVTYSDLDWSGHSGQKEHHGSGFSAIDWPKIQCLLARAST